MRTRALLTTLALLLLVPATAGAAVRHVIKGAGFGHGIGMSQYGAYGYSLEGGRFKGILAHYYKGTELESAPGRPVRVLLQPNDPYIRIPRRHQRERPCSAPQLHLRRAAVGQRRPPDHVVGAARGAVQRAAARRRRW